MKREIECACVESFQLGSSNHPIRAAPCVGTTSFSAISESDRLGGIPESAAQKRPNRRLSALERASSGAPAAALGYEPKFSFEETRPNSMASASNVRKIVPRYAKGENTVIRAVYLDGHDKHFSCDASYMTQCMIAHMKNMTLTQWVVTAMRDRVVTDVGYHRQTLWSDAWPKVRRALTAHLHTDRFRLTHGID